ncbi:MAG: alpha amylase C-terminal domain-containing protein, partial [Lacipirellulaceae bacterium]
KFVHPIRAVVSTPNDAERSMHAVKDALCYRYNLDAFERVIYSESHDEVANGKKRVPSEIDEADPDSWFAQKRSTLAAALVFTAPGIPMIFQGQEFLRGNWFDDSNPIDWTEEQECQGIVGMYRELIKLRLNREGKTAGLTGQRIEVHHVNDAEKLIAFRRWKDGGHGDDTVIIANFSNRGWEDYRVGFVRPGEWRLLFDSNAQVYSEDFEAFPTHNVQSDEGKWDGLAYNGSFSIAPYSVLIYGQ